MTPTGGGTERGALDADQTEVQTGVRVELRLVVKQFRLPTGERLTAADEVSLDVAAGQFLALMGPSGSGKSTLLHLIGGIEAADSGTITIDGTDITRLSRKRLAQYRRSIGFVFQSYHLLPALPALDNVMAPLLPYHTSFDKQARAAHLLDAVGLAGRHDALPSRLSGGQQQRVGIARALINNPGLLLADEPTGNLDSHSGSAVLELITRLRAERGTTIILATHDPAIAAQADRTIHIADGHITDPSIID